MEAIGASERVLTLLALPPAPQMLGNGASWTYLRPYASLPRLPAMALTVYFLLMNMSLSASIPSLCN